MSNWKGKKNVLREWTWALGRNAVVRSGSAAGVIKGTGLIVAFLLQIMLARMVSDPSQYGIYAWGQNLLFLLGSVFALGIPLATSRLVAIHDSRGDNEALAEASTSGAKWITLTSLAGSTVAIIVILNLPESVFEELPRPVALMAAAASSLVALTHFHQAVARARSRLAMAFLPMQVFRPLLTFLLALGWFAWIQRNPVGIELLGAVCLSLLLVLALQILLSRRRKRGLSQDQASSRIQPETSNCRYDSSRIIPSALPIFATRISDLLIQYGNVFVLGMLAGPAVAAGFFVAERLSMLASVPRQVISSVIQPWMASAHAQDNRAELQKTITHAGHATLWPTILAVAILMIMGSLLLGMFGTEYRSTYPVLAILLISHLLGAALGPTQQVLIMSGNQGLVMKAMAVAASVHLIALVLLIPWLGALGAALANLLSTSVARIGCQFLVRSRLGLDPSVIAPLRQKTPSDRNHEND